ncbi:MAG TPA: hypothetical protein PL051_03125 [Candidatus Saccharibacteria bacterium]|nr:hypothetical protein [Candidatus Saccharibacteria bacterium]
MSDTVRLSLEKVFARMPFDEDRLERPGLQKDLELLDAAFSFFDFLPEDDDIRWPLIATYAAVMHVTRFSRLNFENAYRAKYLSAEASYRSGYKTTMSDENNLQLARALSNLASKSDVRDGFNNLMAAEGDLDDDIELRLALTDRLSVDPTKAMRAVTPCPEALYQLRLFQDGEYIARTGFNIHREAGARVLSIVNLQGVPGASAKYEAFRERFGKPAFNYLVDRALNLFDDDTIRRGIVNPKGNTKLYWAAFEAEGVPHFHATYKEAID